MRLGVPGSLVGSERPCDRGLKAAVKVLVLTLGTRGDVQPFVALARGLLAVGHEVVLTAPRRYAEFAAAHDVPFAGVDIVPGSCRARCVMDGNKTRPSLVTGKLGRARSAAPPRVTDRDGPRGQ